MPITTTTAAIKKKKVLTPEEEKRIAEGASFIQQREKAAAQAGGGVQGNRIAAQQMTQQEQIKQQAPDLFSTQQIPLQQSQTALEQTQQQIDQLAGKQNVERQLSNAEIDRINAQRKDLTSSERLTAAGQATIGSIASGIFGATPKNPTGGVDIAPGINQASELALKAVGAIAGTRIAGISISSLFDTGGNVKELRGDVVDNVKESRRISIAATTKGADVQTAISENIKLEESIRAKFNAAMFSLRTSPGDIKDGLNLADEMSAALKTVQENRWALERFALTGDPSQMLLMGQ